MSEDGYVKWLEQQLQTAKEENRTLERKLEFKQIDFDRAMNDFSESNVEIGVLEDIIKDKNIEIDTLTQQNKQMRENINNIKNICNEDWEDMTVDKFQNQLLQAKHLME